MALAYARVESRPDLGRIVTDITLDGSYPAGGYALDNRQLGMLNTPKNVHAVYRTVQGNLPMWDAANNKLKIFESGTAAGPLAECIAADITTAHIVRVTAEGDPVL